MPIYEYECKACEHELEVLQKISDPLLSECPSCGKETLHKRISAPSFRLKGGGWYETDFKTGNKRNLAGEGGDAKPAADKAAAKKDGDTKTGQTTTAVDKPKPAAPKPAKDAD